MDLNPIQHPSPATKMKCSFLDYVQLLMICRAGRWTRTPSATHLQPKKWNAHFWIMFNFWWSAEQSKQKMSSEMQKNEKGPLSHRKIKCSFLDYIQLLMIGRGIWAKNVNQNAKKWKRPPKSSKNKMFIFGLCSSPDDWRGWSMDSNPVCHPSPAKKMKCSFLDYVQLLMICQAGQWTWTPCATPLQPKRWNAHFWITFNFWWLAE